jgi:O-antigen ligase
MKRAMRTLIAPAYLLACICFGGSAQAIWGNFALQIAGIAILVFAAADRSLEPFGGDARTLAGLLIAALLLVLIQLIPTPPSVWTHFSGRGAIAEGFKLLHWPFPWLPVSEAPFDTVSTLPALVPPLAMIAAIQVGRDEKRLVLALTAGVVLSILLGALQVAGGADSSWYFYHFTNTGAVGFFANGNHMASLLIAAIPFSISLPLLRASSTGGRGRSIAAMALAAIGVAIILIGIVLNGSLAALLMLVPVLLASALIFPAGWRLRWIAAPLAAVALIGSVIALSVHPAQPGSKGFEGAEVSVESREAIWSTTLIAVKDSFPFGTGLGTFQAIYPRYEDPNRVDAVYVNHAHNDYLELALELGAPGLVLILAFLGWWAARALRVWRSKASSPMAKAATIASAAILAHSLVDFPLRTSAMAAVFAICLALMFQEQVRRRNSGRSSTARHISIG